MSQMPKIQVCIPIKNDAQHLPTFLEQIKKLSYPHELLKITWMYGRSVDNTLEIIQSFHKDNDFTFTIYKDPVYNNVTHSAMWMADVCNAFKQAWHGEEYALFLDVDLELLPENLVETLVKQNKDIIAPYIYVNEDNVKRFYDTYVFRYQGQKFSNLQVNEKEYDMFNPPFTKRKKPVELDSVGTCILIKSEPYIKVNWENPAPHYQFCKNARKLGYKVYALPSLEVYHKDVRNEPMHASVEYLISKGLLPQHILEKMKE